MLLRFDVAGTPAEFRWSGLTGSAVLDVGNETTQLQDPTNLSTHFRASTTRGWKHRVDGHDIEIVKVRPLFFAGLRRNHFTVKVDGAVVAESSGK